MTNWKDFERRCAALIGGTRYPANMGGFVDVESAEIVGQCKEVNQMSLAEASRLVMKIEAEGVKAQKLGVLFAKSHEGRGIATLPLVIIRMDSWWLDRTRRQPWNTSAGPCSDAGPR